MHLRAQKTVVDVAAEKSDAAAASATETETETDASTEAASDNKSAELAGLLSQVLSQLGLPSSKEELSKSLEKVDIKGGDSNGILTAVSGYLTSASTAAESAAEGTKEKIDALTQQGKQIIDSILPSLGVVPKKKGLVDGAEDESVTSSEKKVADGKNGLEVEPVEIVDVRDFKTRLPLSEGLRAVRELAEFEELEAKL